MSITRAGELRAHEVGIFFATDLRQITRITRVAGGLLTHDEG